MAKTCLPAHNERGKIVFLPHHGLSDDITSYLHFFTQQHNAESFVQDHGNDVRFCPDTGKWYGWNGKRWLQDPGGEIMVRAKHTIKNLGVLMAQSDIGTTEDWIKHIQRSLRLPELRAMITLAQSEPGIPITMEAFDTNSFLVNCNNGTLDLRQGNLRDHKRDDFCTKMLPVDFDPHAPYPEWGRFLTKITDGNDALMAYLQRVAGYALTGDTREQCLFFLYGSGANGKSVFLETLMTLLGDYARQAAFTTFTASKHGDHRPRNDIARLHGARFVSAVEMAEGKRFDEVVIKQLTGQDMITCRYLYSEHFQFKPQFKIFLAANHKPIIRGADSGIWRRIRLIPFTVRIPTSQQDKTLSATLRRELPGILAWAVQGCLAWQENGLDEPADVVSATERYRQEMDPLSDFIGACCIEGRTCQTPFRQLYDAYVQFSREQDDAVINEKQFTTRLSERGYESARISFNSKQVRGWRGIALQADAPMAAIEQSDRSGPIVHIDPLASTTLVNGCSRV